MAIVRIPIQVNHPNLPSPAFNIWHGRVDSLAAGATGTSAPLDDMVNALHAFYVSASGAIAGGSTIVFPSSVVSPVDSSEFAVTPAASITAAGGSAGEMGLALTVGWRTSVAGRRGRGRTFLGPVPLNMCGSSGKPDPGIYAGVVTGANALVSASLSDNGWALGVWGQQDAHVPGPHVLRDFTSYKIGAKFAHLRSRRD